MVPFSRSAKMLRVPELAGHLIGDDNAAEGRSDDEIDFFAAVGVGDVPADRFGVLGILEDAAHCIYLSE